MFESGRFESEYYHAQRDFIATVVIIVIAVSIMYFVVVFVSELYTSLAPRKVANRRRGRKDGLKDASSRPLPMDTHKDNADDNEQVEAAEMNPMFIAMQKRAAASGGAAAGAGAGAASSVDRGQLDDLAAAYSKVCARERPHRPAARAWLRPSLMRRPYFDARPHAPSSLTHPHPARAHRRTLRRRASPSPARSRGGKFAPPRPPVRRARRRPARHSAPCPRRSVTWCRS